MLASATIFGLVYAVFRSFRFAVLVMIPNVTPVILFFGLLGLGIAPLSLPTSMIGCSVLGVAVDDTIHSLVSYRRLRDGGATPEHAVLVTMREVGPADGDLVAHADRGLPHHHRLGLRDDPRVRLAVGADHGDLPGRRPGDAAGAAGAGSRVIELVVFDMDGVLAHLDRPRRLELLAEMTGRTPAFLQAAIWDSDFEPGAEARRYATGDEYLAEWNWRTRCRLTRAQWVRARREAMTLQPETLRDRGRPRAATAGSRC